MFKQIWNLMFINLYEENFIAEVSLIIIKTMSPSKPLKPASHCLFGMNGLLVYVYWTHS